MTASSSAKRACLPVSCHWKTLLSREPVAFDFVAPGFLRGTVGALVSPGGVGKSYWTLALAVATAVGAKADLTGLAPARGRVLFLSGEDPEEVLTARMQALVAKLEVLQPKLRPEQLEAALAQLDYRSCLGLELDVLDAACFAELVSAAHGCRLVVLDTLTRFHNLDENSAPDMKRVLGALERLAAQSGAAVLYLHHTNKAAVLNGQGAMQQAARGSSVLVDNARWSAFLAPMSEGDARRFGLDEAERANYVRWNVSKQNYAAPMPDRWYRRSDGGVLLPVELLPMRAPAPRNPGAAEAVPTPIDLGTYTVPGPAVAETAPAAPPPAIPSAKNAYNGAW